MTKIQRYKTQVQIHKYYINHLKQQKKCKSGSVELISNNRNYEDNFI